MKYLIVDSEEDVLAETAAVIKECVSENAEILLSKSAEDAVGICRQNDIYVVFSETSLTDMDGIELSRRLSEISPGTNIIFITAHPERSLEAWDTNASAFLVKPANGAAVKAALAKLRAPRPEKLCIKCFGSFKITYGSEPIFFRRKKSMEFFAYLIHRMGAETTEDKLRYILWEEDEDTSEKSTYIRSLAYDIRTTFKQRGIDDILINTRNSYRIDTQKTECDYYSWVNGVSPRPIGEYMEDYTWAESTRVYIDNHK